MPTSMEKEFREVFEEIGKDFLHHSGRPKIEMQILAFVARCLGPSTEGIAKEMGISSKAAAVHLETLVAAGRICGQPAHGNETAWQISQSGRQFLDEYPPKKRRNRGDGKFYAGGDSGFISTERR